jgi:ABC-type ATPase involved in cell division
MPSIDLVVKTEVSRSSRAQQLSAMFDVPPAESSECRWKFKVPYDKENWQVGLIVGPSGAGKTTVARELFGEHVDVPMEWGGKSVIDDFSGDISMEDIAAACQAVGFNTIPSWLRPFAVLSTGERFRVELARRLLECEAPVVVDEFTSVVDRQVAKIGAHAVQKYARREGKQFVAVTCHYDVIDWLQPDWVIEPGIGKFARRSLQRRPELPVEIARVDYAAWRLFAPYHYLTASLHRAANCFCLFVDGEPASFAGVLHRPHPKTRNLKGISRLVTLPDWQGLGLAFVLMDALGAAYKSLGYRLHTYPAHPALIRSMDRSKRWALRRRPGSFVLAGKNSTNRNKLRPCATFAYAGDGMNQKEAMRLTGTPPVKRALPVDARAGRVPETSQAASE